MSLLNWLLKRKLVDENGEYFYHGVSVTKIAVVLSGFLKLCVEPFSAWLVQQGIINTPIHIPIQVYEFLGGLGVIAHRDAITTQTTSPDDK